MHYSHLKNVDLNLLIYLDHLLRRRSVTLAAQDAGITQSAMSRALGRLRQQLGDPLLVLTGRRLEPTPRALELMEPLRDVLHQLDERLYRSTTFDPHTTQRRFTIVCPDFADEIFFAPLMAQLSQQAPGLQLRLLGPRPGLQDALAQGSVDLALGVVSTQNSASLRAVRLFNDPFVCLLDPTQHPTTPLTLDAFAQAPHIFIAPGGRPGGVVDTVLAAVGRQRQVAVQLTSFLVAGAFVTGTNRILTLPKRVALHIAQRFALDVSPIPLALPTVTISMLWHARHHDDPAHRWFRQNLRRITQ